VDTEGLETDRSPIEAATAPPWIALIVDDDPAIHEVTQMLLARASFEGRAIALHHAYSAEEAGAFLEEHPETTLVLLDVVMETDDAGLRLCRHIRETLDNSDVQIVLRTGQPGQAPEREVVLDYEINGYFLKTELTAQKLHSIIICALRTWNYIKSLRQRGDLKDSQVTPPPGHSIILGVRDALEKGEMEVLAQPQLSLPDGELIGIEIIPIWRTSDDHEIRGSELLDTAEREGEIERLSRWLITECCRLARIWCATSSTALRVAVNVSAAELATGAVPAEVKRCLEQSGLDPRCLALAISEVDLMREPGASASTLKLLQRVGVSIIVDEFGTGPASIAQLKQLEPDCLKIARSVVARVATDLDSAAIARSIIALAHTLDMSVIADGVETKEQLEFLKWEHCETVQGNFFAPPMAPERLTTFVESHCRKPVS